MSDVDDKPIEDPEESIETPADIEDAGSESESDYGTLTSGYNPEPTQGYPQEEPSAYTNEEPYTLDRDSDDSNDEITLDSEEIPEDLDRNESASISSLEEAVDHQEFEADSIEQTSDQDDDIELIIDHHNTLPEEAAEEDVEYEDDEGADTFEEQKEHTDEKTEASPQVTHLSDDSPTTRVGIFFASAWLTIPIILLGIGLRAAWYWRNRAVWHDEGNLTVELVGRTFRELLQPLGNEQSAPIGFLFIVKSITQIFGNHEYALRAFPLFASCTAIIVLYFLGRKVTDKGSVTLALAIFAISLPLMRYGSELKQYSTDVFIAATLTLLAVSILREPFTRGAAILFAIVGAIAIWFSHPALFVLAGAGSALGIHALLSKDWNKAGGLIVVALIWIGSFALDYFVSLQHYAADDILRAWHIDSYFMLPPERPWPAAVKWVIWRFVDMFQWPMGLALPGLGVVGFFVGISALWKTRRAELFVLFLPILAALGASYFGRYPIANRFLHFYAPALILITATGLAFTVRILWTRYRPAACILIIWILLQPAFIAINEIRKEPAQGARPVVSYLKENQQPADNVYIFYWLRNEFKYYAEQYYDYDMSQVQIGVTSRRDWSWYIQEMESLAGNERVWFAFIDNEDHLGQGERQFFETTLNEMGAQLDKQTWATYTLYLYDLSDAPIQEINPGTSSSESNTPVPQENTIKDTLHDELQPEIIEDSPEESVEQIHIE